MPSQFAIKVLVVAGGASRRMGRDKSQIERSPGVRQIDYLIELARRVSADVLVSSNDADKVTEGLSVIPDLNPGAGPLAALEAFHARHPGEPVLLLGCDLFLMDEYTLVYLLENRDMVKGITAYANRIDGVPEPLCAIYEAEVVAAAGEAIAAGESCARHFIKQRKHALLELPNLVALDGANTPEELDEVFAKLNEGAKAKQVKLVYYAKLREERGCHEETIETLACTCGGLYEELRFRHRFSLSIKALRCARNGGFCHWNQLIEDGDEIIFMPPVAGG